MRFLTGLYELQNFKTLSKDLDTISKQLAEVK